MSNQMLMYMMIGIGVLFAIIVLAYILISKKLNSSETREIQKLRQGTQAKKFTPFNATVVRHCTDFGKWFYFDWFRVKVRSLIHNLNPEDR